jgi:hypothetical protein
MGHGEWKILQKYLFFPLCPERHGIFSERHRIFGQKKPGLFQSPAFTLIYLTGLLTQQPLILPSYHGPYHERSPLPL